RQLKLDYGVYPYHVDLTDDRDVMRSQALQIARASKVVSEGDLVVLICGSLGSGKSTSDTMIIAEA
ncbi:MAG: pyruvate kinase alpha/beta domain-containing protein, partial [Spirochaetales bacterium]|nr:pyruvate kinase alpha/beta domain-containing protein [Spirochaetales bacterium]